MTGPISDTNRRAFLASGLALLSVGAGCAGRPGGGTTPEESRTATSDDAETSTEETDASPSTDGATESDGVEVGEFAVRRSFFYNTSPDQMDVHGVEGRQFLFAGVDAGEGSADAPAAEAFELVAGGDRFAGTVEPAGSRAMAVRSPVGERVYSPEHGNTSGWIAFEVSTDVALDSPPRVAWGDGEATLPESVRKALQTPVAAFDLVTFEVPESVPRGESFEIRLAVENASDATGTFRGVLNESGPSYIPHTVSREVAPSERAESSWTFSYEDVDEFGYDFVSVAGGRTGAVSFGTETATGE